MNYGTKNIISKGTRFRLFWLSARRDRSGRGKRGRRKGGDGMCVTREKVQEKWRTEGEQKGRKKLKRAFRARPSALQLCTCRSPFSWHAARADDRVQGDLSLTLSFRACFEGACLFCVASPATSGNAETQSVTIGPVNWFAKVHLVKSDAVERRSSTSVGERPKRER